MIAVLFVLATLAASYTSRGRPYGLLMGWGALSLLCWQSAADESRRGRWLIGLAFSLGAAVATHFYACLLFVPLIIGELARSVSQKIVDWRIWLALAIGATPFLAFLPILSGARAVLTNYYSPPQWNSIVFAYQELLAPSAARAALILIAASIRFRKLPPTDETETQAPAPIHEIAALIGLSLLPVFGWIVALSFTNAYISRYVLPSVMGVGALLALRIAASGERQRRLSAGVLLILITLFVGNASSDFLTALQSPGARSVILERYRLLLSTKEENLPVVVATAKAFFEIAHYAPVEMTRRLVYLYDRKAALRYLGTDTSDVDFPLICRSAGLNCQDYTAFTDNHPEFLLYQTSRDWLFPKLADDKASLTVSRVSGTTVVYRVKTNLVAQ